MEDIYTNIFTGMVAIGSYVLAVLWVFVNHERFPTK